MSRNKIYKDNEIYINANIRYFVKLLNKSRSKNKW